MDNVEDAVERVVEAAEAWRQACAAGDEEAANEHRAYMTLLVIFAMAKVQEEVMRG